jgi:uncharacterized protein (DUF952 family)
MTLFHIATRRAWEAARAEGVYRAPSLATEGFIHLSTDRQWLEVANLRFCGVLDLVLLAIRTDRLRAEVRFEPVDGDDYPHLYGPLEIEAVVEVLELPIADDGTIGVPRELAPWRHYFVRPETP